MAIKQFVIGWRASWELLSGTRRCINWCIIACNPRSKCQDPSVLSINWATRSIKKLSSEPDNAGDSSIERLGLEWKYPLLLRRRNSIRLENSGRPQDLRERRRTYWVGAVEIFLPLTCTELLNRKQECLFSLNSHTWIPIAFKCFLIW